MPALPPDTSLPPYPPKVRRMGGRSRQRARRRAEHGNGNETRRVELARLREARRQALLAFFRAKRRLHEAKRQRRLQLRQEEKKRRKRHEERVQQRAQGEKLRPRKNKYVDDEAEEEGASSSSDDGSEAELSDLVDDAPITQDLSFYMSTRRIPAGATLREFARKRSRPPTLNELKTDALKTFRPTPNIRHREDRLPPVLDPTRRAKMEKYGLIEQA